MNLPNLFVLCPHCGGTGQVEHYVTREAAMDAGFGPEMYEKGFPDQCPTCSSVGYRPATLEDLGGEKVWWCLRHEALETAEEGTCEIAALRDVILEFTRPTTHNEEPCDMVERILIPLPDSESVGVE